MKTIRTDIEEAAVAYAQSECSDKIPAFRAGAAYIMSLPLCDRLTRDEKKQIKAIYFRKVYSVEDVRKNFTEKCLIDAIFGTAMFEEKGESYE